MYKIECSKEFKMPLQVLSYQERYRLLLQKSKKKKVVYIKNEFDNSTFRYRCYNVREALTSSKKYEVTYFLCEEIPKIMPYLETVDILIFQRTSWTIEVENLIHFAHMKKIPIVYDMDDLLYKIDYVPSFMNHIGVSFNKTNTSLYLSIASGYEMVAKRCDAYIVTTDFLKKKIEEDYQKPTFVIPNFLNHEQEEESQIVLKNREEEKEKFVIGYFSGSPSHRNDFRVVERDLVRLLEKYQNIYVKIVGFMQLEGKLKKYQTQGRVIFEELVPYPKLQYEIGGVDVNMIPLVANDFNQAKSELKFFEAGIVKVPSCMTPTEVYQNLVCDGVDGLFCNPGEWFDKIELLYQNAKFRKQIGQKAYEKVCQNYLNETKTHLIEEVYQKLECLPR